ncbi:LOW QUALITY PROTEIN: Glucose-6-phosphate 1-dehydrogenase, partial [Galemys pyrenaicus]
NGRELWGQRWGEQEDIMTEHITLGTQVCRISWKTILGQCLPSTNTPSSEATLTSSSPRPKSASRVSPSSEPPQKGSPNWSSSLPEMMLPSCHHGHERPARDTGWNCIMRSCEILEQSSDQRSIHICSLVLYGWLYLSDLCLGKEMVQNFMVLRIAKRICENMARVILAIKVPFVKVAMMLFFTYFFLVAMEKPNSINSVHFETEKVKLLKSISSVIGGHCGLGPEDREPQPRRSFMSCCKMDVRRPYLSPRFTEAKVSQRQTS